MSQDTAALPEPTTSAATRETEPEVWAGIMSGNTSPDVPRNINVGGGGLPYGKLALLLAGGIALGYGISRYRRR